jgi:hypothetical protein
MKNAKRVRCKRGMIGWRCKLQDNYDSFEVFQAYASIYDILPRLGFKTEQEAWDANPLIEGSVEPSDMCTVKA